MSPRRVLVPTDFSPASDAAVEYAFAFAKELDGYVLLLHVVEHSLPTLPDRPAAEAARHDMGERLARAAEAGRKGGVPTDTVMRDGRPWRVIVDTARELDVDLVVMATHGRKGLPDELTGSVAERVVRRAPCPVLTMRS